eukprot:gnl/MRDRNA2_/MRDRNA2_33792_c0_seq1.p1 gnl/MRDRNA2_/MRDRNA2_33792_c0~~gnl/MRDRNA2_/MRDRNA2_33792_c0_seq1.p1  ORF type:complete len:805 (+),score=173.04 gnl/MRDRNA2_/MRDRNA2_33792_c0_seq1:107-2521(+)
MEEATSSTENAKSNSTVLFRGRGVPPGWRERIHIVKGKVIKARGLMDLDAWGKSDPYCLIKGIKGNGRMVSIARSPVIMDDLNPIWNFEFEFECPQEWGYTELVGVKFLVFDSDEGSFDANDDFLGGCDIDIADEKDYPNRQVVHKDLELLGQAQGKKQVRGVSKKRKARIEFDVSVHRIKEPAPITRFQKMLNGAEKLIRVYEVEGVIVRASGLRDADVAGLSDPYCIVMMQFISGKEHEIARTAVINDTLDPEWNESFHLGFTKNEEPVALKFDIYDTDEGEIGGGDDDHLGGVHVLLAEVIEQNLTVPQRFTFDLQALAGSGAAALGDGATGMFKKKKKKGLGTVTIELFAKAILEPLPLVDLLHPPPDNEELTKERIIPAPFRRKDEDVVKKSTNVKKPLGKERVFFLSGRVLFATNLVDADLWGKSDPYCVVECPIEGSNEPLQVHRTRTCDDDLNPVWQEAFTCIIPEHMDVKKIVFSVFDDDDGEMADKEGDFLGRASVELAEIGHGQVCREEAPLVGIKKKRKAGQGLRGGGFKRDSTIAYEVRVERRIVKIPQDQVDNSAEAQAQRLGLTAKPRHIESRRPDLSMYRNKNLEKQFVYTDPSMDSVADFERASAQRVMQYRDFKVFAAATASSGWSMPSSNSHGRLKRWLRPMEEVSKDRRWASSTSQSFFKGPTEDMDEEVTDIEDKIMNGAGLGNVRNTEKDSDEWSKLQKRQGRDYDFTGFRPDRLQHSSSLPRVPISSVFGRPGSEQASNNAPGLRQSLSRGSTPIFAGGVDPQTSIRELKFRPPIMMFDRR